MFRFQTYAKLTRKNIVIVGRDGSEKNLESGSAAEVRQHFETNGAMGFYLKFVEKFHSKKYAKWLRIFFGTQKNIKGKWTLLQGPT